MKRFEFIKTLSLVQMRDFFYFNRDKTGKGMKKILEWLDEEVTEKDLENAGVTNNRE